MKKGLIALFSLMAVGLGLSAASAMMGEGFVSDEVRGQLEAAITNRDYAEWLRLREENNLPMRGRVFSVVDEGNFETFALMHEARLAGDTELVDQYRAELGLGSGRQLRVRAH